MTVSKHGPALLALSLLAIGLLGLAGCGSAKQELPTAQISGTAEDSSAERSGDPAHSEIHAAAGSKRAPVRKPLVVIETSLGPVTLRLFPEEAPKTVDNFLANYVERNFYEGTIVHHVEKGFLVAAGGYTAELEPKPTRAWIRNESSNGLSNRRGTVAMGRQPEFPHSATSQFLINLADNPALDYQPAPDGGEPTDGYCVFGEVVEGMEIVDQMAEVEVHSTGHFPSVPVTPIVISSARRVD